MDSINFQLQFDPKRITELAERFSYEKTELEESITTVIKMNVSQKQYLTLDELKVVAEWKTERSKSRVAKNEKEDVEECTKISLSAKSERLRVGSLLILEGIEYPTASVILHFFHADRYPILDFRALEALGVSKPNYYAFDFWMKYVTATRKIADENGVDMRTLDKALWQWSKEKEKKSTR